MTDIPIVGQKSLEPKCPHCEAQPMTFANAMLKNVEGQMFMIFFCSGCQNVINIDFLGIEQAIQAPHPLTMKTPLRPV
jgi:hypothetical protein